MDWVRFVFVDILGVLACICMVFGNAAFFVAKGFFFLKVLTPGLDRRFVLNVGASIFVL